MAEKITYQGQPFKLDPTDPASPYLRRTGYREVSFAEADGLARQWAEGHIRSPAESIQADIEFLESNDPNMDVFEGSADPYVEDYEIGPDGIYIPTRRKRAKDVLAKIDKIKEHA